MTSNGQTHDIAEIRKLLAAAFDDVGLVALCQDEFPDLCESLGRGLRKDEILNVILDHFRRSGDFGPLLAAVQSRKPGMYVRFEPTLRVQTRPSTVETTPVSRDQGFLNRVYQILRDSAVWQRAIVIVGFLACIVIVGVLAILLPMQTVLWPPTPTLAPSPTPTASLYDAHVSFVITPSSGVSYTLVTGDSLFITSGDAVLIKVGVTIDQTSFPRNLHFQYFAPKGSISPPEGDSNDPGASYVASVLPGPDVISLHITDPETREGIVRSIHVVVEEKSPRARAGGSSGFPASIARAGATAWIE